MSSEALPKSSDPTVKFSEFVYDQQDGKGGRGRVPPLRSFITPVGGLVHNVR